MLTLKQIKENYDQVIAGLEKKKFKNIELIDEIVKTDDLRKESQKKADDASAELNNISKTIGKLFQEGKKEEAEAAREKTVILKDEIKTLTDAQKEAETALEKLLVLIPNIPHISVPVGSTAEDNEIIRSGGTVSKPKADDLPHWDLAKKYDIIDFELGVKITGAGFPLYKNRGSKLQRALINFFLDEAINNGYIEVQPPILVNEDSGFGTVISPTKRDRCTM